MANTHDTATLFDELGYWHGDWVDPWIVTGGLPALGGGLTTAPFATTGYTRTEGRLRYVVQPAASVTLTEGYALYTLGLHAETTGTVGAWTRQAGTHYIWLPGTVPPDTTSGITWLCELTVSGGVITAITDRRWLVPRRATEGQSGLVELAATAETVTGTDTTRAVTPAGVGARVGDVTQPMGASRLFLSDLSGDAGLVTQPDLAVVLRSRSAVILQSGGDEGPTVVWNGTDWSPEGSARTLGRATQRWAAAHLEEAYVSQTLHINTASTLGIALRSTGTDTTMELENLASGGQRYVLQSSGTGSGFGPGQFVIFNATTGGIPLRIDGATNTVTCTGSVVAPSFRLTPDPATMYVHGTVEGRTVVAGPTEVLIQQTTSGRNAVWDGANWFPQFDTQMSFGGPSNRILNLYIVNAPIVSSDAREKTALDAEPLGLDWLLHLLPRVFRRPEEEDVHHGFVAQEVEAVTPPGGGLVVRPTTAEGPYGLRESELIAPLVKAVQELAAQVTALTARVATLEDAFA